MFLRSYLLYRSNISFSLWYIWICLHTSSWAFGLAHKQTPGLASREDSASFWLVDGCYETFLSPGSDFRLFEWGCFYLDHFQPPQEYYICTHDPSTNIFTVYMCIYIYSAYIFKYIYIFTFLHIHVIHVHYFYLPGDVFFVASHPFIHSQVCWFHPPSCQRT